MARPLECCTIGRYDALQNCVAIDRTLCFLAQHDLLRQQMVRLKFNFDRLMYCSHSAAPLAGTTRFQTALHPATLSCSIMCHTRPRYLTLGDLQTMFKLPYLGGGPTDQSCADCVATDRPLCFSAQHDLLQQQIIRLKLTSHWLMRCRQSVAPLAAMVYFVSLAMQDL